MMDARLHSQYLEAMGIQQWVSRDSATPAGDLLDDAGNTLNPDPQPPVDLPDWTSLEAQVSGCTRCALSTSRNRTVFGTGNRNAEWLIIGEAPGADEDQQGEPFVGRAGQLLTEMLLAIDYQRADVYITNILKCRPPDNRNPRPEEADCCRGYLEQQIALLRPSLILAVGGVAAHNLLQTDTAVGKLRGVLHHFGPRDIPLVVTYHPSYLLRSPQEKRKVWQDLQFARDVYREQLQAT